MRASTEVRLAMRAVGATALLLVVLVGPVLAQSGASTGLMGQVTDSSGAAVPGVTVTLTNVETGQRPDGHDRPDGRLGGALSHPRHRTASSSS